MVFSIRILGRLFVMRMRHGFLPAVLGAAALAACGQKGPLFIPVPPQAPVASVPAATPPAAPASAVR
jgi:predicted small lipoprotein YifL